MIKILIAPNSFKECLDSVSAAGIFELSLKEQLKIKYPRLQYEMTTLPLSDGGDGFLEVCTNIFSLKRITVKVRAPYDESSLSVPIGYDEKNKTVYIESAELLGMKRVPERFRHPLDISSRGVGELLLLLSKPDEFVPEVSKVVIGVGGTATSDLGVGMASVLGLKILDSSGHELLPVPRNFELTEDIIWNPPHLGFSLEAVLDVNNPLLGEEGANYVFAPQKGASDEDVLLLERGMSKLLKIFSGKRNIGKNEPPPGAGGGLAAGLRLFLNSHLISSEEFVKGTLGLDRRLSPHVVITAEGRFDRQSLLRKATGIVIEEFADTADMLFICAGSVDRGIGPLPANVKTIELMKYFSGREEAMQNIAASIRHASSEIIDRLISAESSLI